MFHSIPVVSDLCRQFLGVVLIILAIILAEGLFAYFESIRHR